MIISKLQGGLGNQLFQWAVARSYSDVHNCDHKLDTSFYPYQNFRQLELYNFENLTFSTINRFDIGNPIIEINDNYHFQEFPFFPLCSLFIFSMTPLILAFLIEGINPLNISLSILADISLEKISNNLSSAFTFFIF